jgi:hypothetical protein
LVFALLDFVLLVLLVRLIKAPAFIQLNGVLPLVTVLAFGGIWAWALSGFWQSVYAYLFPTWSRWFLPFAEAILAGTVAWLAVRWAPRLPGPVVLIYCLMGGLWGVLGHILGVVLGLVTKPPVLQGAAPAAVLFIAFFEFIFYWSVIVLLSFLGRLIWKRLTGTEAHSQARVQ